MTDRDDRARDPRRSFETWIAREAREQWPDARVRYRSRAKQGSHYWQIDAPGVGEFWISVTDGVLEEPAGIENATESLETLAWLDRLTGVPSHGVQVRPGGRVLRWDPVRDDTEGYLAE